ncbi:hypothetical protein CYMTET_35015, partial [Cymbomonas tetramitiformis]
LADGGLMPGLADVLHMEQLMIPTLMPDLADGLADDGLMPGLADGNHMPGLTDDTLTSGLADDTPHGSGLADDGLMPGLADGTSCQVGGNYAATIVPQVSAAQAHGCAQVLYTLPLGEGDENVFVSESGAMNLFFLLTKTDGTEELVSPPLDGTILPGVTRDSILTLCHEWGLEVNERGLSLAELKLAHQEGRLKEVFGSGTACVIQPVNCLKRADGTVLDIPFDVSSENTLIAKLLKGIKEIQYGVVEHPWSVVV